MKKVHIIPDINNLDKSLYLSEKYNTSFEYNDFFSPHILDNNEKKLEIIKEYKKYSLPENSTMHGAFFDVLIFSPDSKIKQSSDYRVCQSLDTALEIGAKAVIFHTNYTPNYLNDAYYETWVNENTMYWNEKIKQFNGIDIYVENMFDFVPYPLLKLAENMKGNEHFGICLDYAHATISHHPIEEWMKSLGPYVKHMHINDNDLDRDLHLPLGDGKIDWDNFVTLYNKYINNSSILIEHTDVEKQEKSLQFFKKFNLK